jgi:hypothetical protein
LTVPDEFETLEKIASRFVTVVEPKQSPREAARKLAPMNRACADGIDAARELPRALFAAFADARAGLGAAARVGPR